MDVLSDVLRAVRMTGAIYFDMNASSPWIGESPSTDKIAATVMPGADLVISFHAVLSGSCWAQIGDGSLPSVRLDEGDIIVFPTGAANVLSSSRGERGAPDMAMYYNPLDQHLPFTVVHGGGGADRTRFICGYLGCDVLPFNPLISALPPVLRAQKPKNARGWVTDFFELAMNEGGSQRVGSESILAKLSELMFVEVIRNHVETLPEHSQGWLAGLRDSHIGKALKLIHAHPTKDWTVERLGREVGLSRSAFAQRFAYIVQMPPKQYLARWRLQLAGRLLEQPGVSIAQAAEEVGYDSEPAFNRAFKRFVGTPPGVWRKSRMRLLDDESR